MFEFRLPRGEHRHGRHSSRSPGWRKPRRTGPVRTVSGSTTAGTDSSITPPQPEARLSSTGALFRVVVCTGRPARRRHRAARRHHVRERRAGAAGWPAAPADPDLRPAAAGSARGGRPRRRPRGHRAGHADRRAHEHRRAAGRAGLRACAVDIGLHPERPRRGRAGHRAHGGVAALRRRQRLRGGALLGDPAGSDHGERDAPRQHPDRARRQLRLVVRHLLRPAQRGPLRGVGGRRPARCAAHQRVAAEPRLEPGVRRLCRPHGRRLGDGGGPSLQVAPLPGRWSPGLGLPGPPRQPLEERIVLPDAAVGGTGASRPLPGVAGRHAGRDQRPAGIAAVRGQALRHRRT